MFQKIAFSAFCIFLISCDKPKENLAGQKTYVDIKNIFEDQVVILENENRKVVKKIIVYRFILCL